jgi:hypothetical protein
MEMKDIRMQIEDKDRVRQLARLQQTTVAALVRAEIAQMVKLGVDRVPPIPPVKRGPASERVKINFAVEQEQWDKAQKIAYETHVTVPDFVRTRLMGKVVKAGL